MDAFSLIYYATFIYVRLIYSCFSLFDAFFFGRSLYATGVQALNNFVSYVEYRVYINRISSNSVEVTYTKDQNEVCSICQDYMIKAIKLRKCKHEFHKYCIIQYICQGGTKCPMCRQEMDLELNNSE